MIDVINNARPSYKLLLKKIIPANQDRLYKNHYNFLHLLSSVFQISVIPSPLIALVPGESQEFSQVRNNLKQKSKVNNCDASLMHIHFQVISFFFFWLCFAARRILVLWQGIKPMTPGLEAWSLNHWTTREFPPSLFYACALSPYSLELQGKRCYFHFTDEIESFAALWF